MVILGGLGSIEGVLVGAAVLVYLNFKFIPDLNAKPREWFDLDLDLSELSSAIYGFLLVMMMVLRPEGLIPERRRKLELTEHVGTGQTAGLGEAGRSRYLRGTRMSTPEETARAGRDAAAERRDPGGDEHHEDLRRPDRGRGRLVRDPARARSSRSSARTAPARPRSSTCSPASTSRRSAGSSSTARTSPAAAPTRSWRSAWRGRSRTSACSPR